MYASGYYSGTADLDPGAGTSSFTSAGDGDAFVMKLNNSGNLVWAKTFTNTASSSGDAIDLDDAGNIYVIGNCLEATDFGNGTILNPNGGSSVFLTKLGNDGDLVYVKGFSGDSGIFAEEVDQDASGNVYLTGGFYGTADFDSGTGVATLTSTAERGGYVVKLTSAGEYIWSQHLGSTGYDNANGIRVNASGDVYVTGTYSGTVDFDNSAATSELTSVGNRDVFALKLSSAGTFQWVKSFGGAENDYVTSLALDAAGNVLLGVSFKLTADFDPATGVSNLESSGGTDVFANKLDPSENYVWARHIGGTGFDDGGNLFADASGAIYTVGSFIGTVDFDPNAGVANLTAVNQNQGDIFVLKLGAPSTVGIQEQSHPGLKIYPNPSNAAITVVFESAKATIHVTDTYGRRLESFPELTSGAVIDLSNLKSAIYFLQVETAEGISLERIEKID